MTSPHSPLIGPQVPQMIMISFNGAVTGQNMDMYERIFRSCASNEGYPKVRNHGEGPY